MQAQPQDRPSCSGFARLFSRILADAESLVDVRRRGLHAASNSVAGMGLFDIDYVEVLKGPARTLCSRVTGGVVPSSPNWLTDTFEGYAAGNLWIVRKPPALEAGWASVGGWPEGQDCRRKSKQFYGDQLANPSVATTSATGARARAAGIQSGRRPGLSHGVLTSRASFQSALTCRRAGINVKAWPLNSIVVNQPNLLGGQPSDAQSLTLDAADALNHGVTASIRSRLKQLATGPVLTLLTDAGCFRLQQLCGQ